MTIMVPERDMLLASIPIFADIKPLKRPRANMFTKGIYQPLDNQKELFAALKHFEALRFDEPVFVDIAINWVKPKSRSDQHPMSSRIGDVDNLAKAVNDALVKAKILADDIYIVGQTVTKAYGSEPMAHVWIWSAARNPIEVSRCSPSVRTNEQPSTPPSLTLQREEDV